MSKWYNEMNCYILLDAQTPNRYKMDKIAERAQLETSFRNYAAVFNKVKIVINNSYVKEYYLNFPHVCYSDNSNSDINLSTLLNDATSDAIFIGHSSFVDFPLSILADLIKSYNGELFMGYNTNNLPNHNLQFGIYHKNLISNTTETINFDSLDKSSYTLLPLPETSDFLF